MDAEKQEVVIKTTIKKYYKRFDIIDLKKLNIKLSKESLSFTHANNTLIVSVAIPITIVQKAISAARKVIGSTKIVLEDELKEAKGGGYRVHHSMIY